jgi:hypothetical protein
MPEQTDWRFCVKCGAMFFDGFPDKGRCAADGGHAAAGFNFVLVHDVPDSANAQKDWRFCQKCALMFFDGFPEKGRCAAGGGHEAAGFNFVLTHDVHDSPTQQGLWRFCEKCNAMYFDGFPLNPDGSPNRGVCVAGGGHEPAGFIFVHPHDIHPAIQLLDEVTQVRASGSGFTPGDVARINYQYKDDFSTFSGGPIDVRMDNRGLFSGVVLSLTVGDQARQIGVQATDHATGLQANGELR